MRKYFIVAFVQLLLVTTIVAEESENALEVWATQYRHSASAGHPPVSVSAYLKHSGDNYVLAFKLTNLSKKSLMVSPHELPWGNPHSITLAAIVTDGQRIPNHYPIADPPIEKQIAIPAGTSREGDYDIGRIVQLSQAPKDKDIVLLWSYRIPGDFQNSHQICTGIVVLAR
jgi:hypothetical protein